MPRPAFDSVNLATRYDKSSEPQFAHGQDLVDLLAIHPGERLLDVGCGTGRLATVAADLVGAQGQVVGIDPAASRIEVAKRRSDPRLEFRVGQAEDLSAYESASFEVVYMNSVLNWLEDKPGAVAQAYRVLKPGGRFGIATTVRDQPNELRQLARHAVDVVLGRREARAPRGTFPDPGMGRGVTLEGVRALLVEAGFEARVFDLRTYVSFFADVAQIIEFLQTSTYDTLLPDGVPYDQFGSALERVIAEEVAASRLVDGIRLERYVLLAVADKPT
ncbi:MAG TPA: methyltransferase domain-containing protein [Casimicrobiaceae bacterium]|nr:methyltransferase domain-containing protein [Casimicrobiaceae bacterium]